MKLCKDCKYVKIVTSEWCKHPSIGINPVGGDLYNTQCFVERHNHIGRRTVCGHEGVLWEPAEPAEPKPTLLQRLKGLFK